MIYTIIIYIICEIIAIGSMFIAKKNEQKSKKRMYIFLILSFLPFALLFIFRGIKVGQDYETYAQTYLSFLDNTLDARQEEWWSVGFKAICYLLSFVFGRNYYGVFAVINLATLFLLYKGIWDNSKNPALSLFILFCFCLPFQIFNQFRQMLAIALTFYAFKYIKKRQFWIYFVFVSMAGLIHTSAFIMLPLYFFVGKELNIKALGIYGAIALAVFLGFDWLKEFISNTYYGRIYFGSSFDVTEMSSIYNLVIRILMFGVSYYFYRKITKNNKENIYLYNLVFFCTLLQLLVVRSYILARLTTYLYIYYVLLIPPLLNEFLKKQKHKTLWITLFICGMLVYQGVYYQSSSGAVRAGYDIYTTFFQD